MEKSIVKKYRVIKRREIKSEIEVLKKNNEQLFKLWAYDKSIDVDFLKKQARENLLKLEENEKMYAATANETPDVNLAMRYLNSRNIPF